MSLRPHTEPAAREREFRSLLRARGYTFHDPIDALLFMAAAANATRKPGAQWVVTRAPFAYSGRR